MTFIPTLGDALAPIVVAFLAAALLALDPDPGRPPARGPLRDGRPARGAPRQRRPDPPRRRDRGGDGVHRGRAGLHRDARPRLAPAVPARGAARLDAHQPADRAAGRRGRGRRARRDRRLPRPPRPLAARRPDRCSASSRSPSASASRSSPTRSAATSSPFADWFAAGFTIFWIVGMINSINFIDGLDGLSSGIAFIAAVTLGLINLSTHGLPADHRRPVLHPRRLAAGVPALEPAPGLDLRGDQRRPVRRLQPGSALDPRDRQGGRRAARARGADHRHVLDHRAAAPRGPLAVQPGPRPHPPPDARPRAVAPADRVRDLRDLPAARPPGAAAVGREPALRVPRASSWPSALVLFIPTRGALRRPEELEADAYDPDPDARDAGSDAPAE